MDFIGFLSIWTCLPFMMSLPFWVSPARSRGKQISTCPRIALENGRVIPRHVSARFKCNSGYKRYGPKRIVCLLGKWTQSPPSCIKSNCRKFRNLGESVQVTYTKRRGVARFKCDTVGLTLEGPSEILCGRGGWKGTPPKCVRVIPADSCDFEKEDLCGWVQNGYDDFDWTLFSGPTLSGFTGPDSDHTFQSYTKGHYMYIETSAPRTTGDQADLYSPLYPAERSDTCFEFWYHMYGEDEDNKVGNLAVYVKPISEDIETLAPSFFVGGNQGNQWIRGEIDVTFQSEMFQIVITATCGEGYAGDIAIDDVSFINCTESSGDVTEIMEDVTTEDFLPVSTTTLRRTSTNTFTSLMPRTSTTVAASTTVVPTKTITTTSKPVTTIPSSSTTTTTKATSKPMTTTSSSSATTTTKATSKLMTTTTSPSSTTTKTKAPYISTTQMETSPTRASYQPKVISTGAVKHTTTSAATTKRTTTETPLFTTTTTQTPTTTSKRQVTTTQRARTTTRPIIYTTSVTMPPTTTASTTTTTTTTQTTRATSPTTQSTKRTTTRPPSTTTTPTTRIKTTRPETTTTTPFLTSTARQTTMRQKVSTKPTTLTPSTTTRQPSSSTHRITTAKLRSTSHLPTSPTTPRLSTSPVVPSTSAPFNVSLESTEITTRAQRNTTTPTSQPMTNQTSYSEDTSNVTDSTIQDVITTEDDANNEIPDGLEPRSNTTTQISNVIPAYSSSKSSDSGTAVLITGVIIGPLIAAFVLGAVILFWKKYKKINVDGEEEMRPISLAMEHESPNYCN